MPPRWTYALAGFLGTIVLTLCLVSASIFGVLDYQKCRAVERERS